jgi:hypothetical protein
LHELPFPEDWVWPTPHEPPFSILPLPTAAFSTFTLTCIGRVLKSYRISTLHSAFIRHSSHFENVGGTSQYSYRPPRFGTTARVGTDGTLLATAALETRYIICIGNRFRQIPVLLKDTVRSIAVPQRYLGSTIRLFLDRRERSRSWPTNISLEYDPDIHPIIYPLSA